MDAFVGKWTATAQDMSGVEEYGKASGQVALMNQYLKGIEVVVTKHGDCWVFDSVIGGQPSAKETLNLSGKYSVALPGADDLDLQMSVQFQEGKLFTEGTIAGIPSKAVRYIENGHFVSEMHAGGVIMTCKMSKA